MIHEQADDDAVELHRMMRSFEATTLSAAETYALMVGIVVPRPVAWITTVDAAGVVNTAPFSRYTFVSSRPPMLAVSIGRRDGVLKDTAANVVTPGEFVVHVAAEDTLVPMHASSATYPPGESEAASTVSIPSRGWVVRIMPRSAAS